MNAFHTGFFLNKNPCAQCGKPIAAPMWFEEERDRVSFAWSCAACDYQFVTIALYGRQGREQPVRHEIRALAA